MRVFRYFRRRCLSLNLRSARLLRAQRALELKRRIEGELGNWPEDVFSHVTYMQLLELRLEFESLIIECNSVAVANQSFKRASYPPLEKRFRALRGRHVEIQRRDAQWNETAHNLKREFRTVLREGQQYEESIQERLLFHERSFNNHLQRASRLSTPEADCAKARRALQDAKEELVIPRRAVQCTRSLPQATKDVLGMGPSIGLVREESSSLARLVNAAFDHCYRGDYVQADKEAEAAHELARRIRGRINELVVSARLAQKQWLEHAAIYQEIGLRFGAHIERLRAISDPSIMLPEWDSLRSQISAYVLAAACSMGNDEQKDFVAEVGADARVEWAEYLNADELRRFALACFRSDEIVDLDKSSHSENESFRPVEDAG